PKSVEKFHSYPLTRIFRVIGGISIITFLSKKYLLFSYPFNFIILFIALLHFIYITIISFIKLFYGIRVLRSNKLEVRNSPIDKPVDEILLGIKNDTRNLEISKKRFDEVANVLKKAEETLDKDSDFTKSEIQELKSVVKEIKNAEQVKIIDLAADLAKKIREY